MSEISLVFNEDEWAALRVWLGPDDDTWLDRLRALPHGLDVALAELEEDEKPIKANTVRTALRRGLQSKSRRFTVEGAGEMATWRRA